LRNPRIVFSFGLGPPDGGSAFFTANRPTDKSHPTT
jgi:hypothetical protein